MISGSGLVVPATMAPKRPPNAVLGEVTKVLALALASCGGGTSSQDAPVVVKLRTLVLALLDSCADTSLGERRASIKRQEPYQWHCHNVHEVQPRMSASICDPPHALLSLLHVQTHVPHTRTAMCSAIFAVI